MGWQQQNAEYGECELRGAFGCRWNSTIAFTLSTPTGIVVSENTIQFIAGECDGIGLRVTSMTPAGSVSFRGLRRGVRPLACIVSFEMLLQLILGSLILCAAGLHNAISAAGEGRKTTKAITACGSLQRSDTTYVLKGDVQSPGTCFSIEADNITLDLNGHTVTYGTGIDSHATFGILAADCWDHEIAGNPCGGSHKRPVIMNGKIVQGAGAAPASHALRFGQSNNLTGVTVHDLDIMISSPDSIAIYGTYLPGGSDIFANTMHNRVTVISSRHQFRGASIKLGEETAAKLPDLIHGNTIVGGAQLGIRDDNPAGSKIYENDVSQAATYTNGFCIDAAGVGMQVFQNKCHPIYGRGIHTNQSNVQIFDNVIETVDSHENVEYKGCEIFGTYGIQVESDQFAPTNIAIYGNRVTVHAAQCPAEAMRLTEIKDGAIQIHDNTFVAVQDKTENGFSTEGARAFSVGETDGSKVQVFRNTMRADSSIFHIGWDSGSEFTFSNNTFQAGREGQKTLLADFENGASPSHDTYFLDNIYQGFVPESAKFGQYTGDSWYGVTTTVSILAVDRNGRPVQNLFGTVLDANQATAHDGVDDGRGGIAFVLPVLRVESKGPVLKYGPYRLTMNGKDCPVYKSTIDSLKTQTILVVLSCP
jgi:hypothetical protein